MDSRVMEVRHRHRRTTSGLTKVAHLFAVAVLILLLVWLLHYREGFNYYSDNPYRVFNLHPFLMVLGLVLCSGEAMLAYKTFPADHRTQKIIHMILNLTAFVLGVVGIRAVFKFHNMLHIENMYSLHSWIGIITICAFGLQWLAGFGLFMVGTASQESKMRMLPWHVCGGRAIFYMSVCASLTGITEKFTFLKLIENHEARVLNFTGLTILLFGIFVDFSIALARYV